MDEYYQAGKDAMLALWSFAVAAKWVEAPESLNTPGMAVVPVCRDQGETNKRLFDEFLSTTGMSFDDQKFARCGVVAFTSMRGLLSSPSMRCLNQQQTNTLFSSRPHQTLHHNDAGHSYWLSGQGHFIIGIMTAVEVKVAIASGGEGGTLRQEQGSK